MNKVLAIVVTYNRLEMLKQCIDRLQAQTFPCDILIVDNASTDGTRMWAASLDSKAARSLMKGNRRPIRQKSQQNLSDVDQAYEETTNQSRQKSLNNVDPAYEETTNQSRQKSLNNVDPAYEETTNRSRQKSLNNTDPAKEETIRQSNLRVTNNAVHSGTQEQLQFQSQSMSRPQSQPESPASSPDASGKRSRPKVIPVEVWTQDTVLSTATVLWDDDAKHHILYENTGENLGGAGGFNYGMRRAVELGYEYAWVMDDDAFAEPDCLEQLMQAADRVGEFGFLTSAVLWKDGSLCKMNYQRKYPTPKKRSERHLLESDLKKDLVRIQSATFVSALFPTKIIREVGLPIKEFFIWCDDIEFTRRITLKHGHPAYVVTSSRITHYIKNNAGTNIALDDVDRIPRHNYAFRNENYMYRQYGLKGFAYYLLVIAFNTYQILAHAPSHKGARLKVVWKNLFTGLSFNPGIEQIK